MADKKFLSLTRLEKYNDLVHVDIDAALESAKSYTNTKTTNMATTTVVDNKISTHNTSTAAHSDIRTLITNLTTKVNNFLDVDDTTSDQLSEVLAMIEANEGTIESLTSGKVNVSDIVDNLTTSSSTKVLSAKQGVALKSLIDELNAVLDSHTHEIADVSGLQTALDNKAAASHGTHVTWSTTSPKMDGTAAVGTETKVARGDHVHPTDTSRAGKTEFDSHVADTTAHITSTERTNWGTAYTHSQAAHAPSNAEKNQNAFSNIKVGTTTVAADTTTDTVEFVGSNVTITPDATNDKITFTIPDATSTTKGVVQIRDTIYPSSSSVAASTKLADTLHTAIQTTNQDMSAMAEGFEAIIVQMYSSDFPTEGDISNIPTIRDIASDEAGDVQTALDAHEADTSLHFTSAEKTKLSGVESGAQKNTITGVKGNSESTYRTGNVNITKANIGLGNVDNTSDANKPVSTAQQTAINSSLESAKSYTDTKVANLLNNSTEAVDSIMELAAAMEVNDDVVEALSEAVGTKANASDLTSHTSNKSNPHGVSLSQLGVTATAAELNIMDGVTATAAELNILDGVTATTAQLNYVKGVTSNIQTQLDSKQAEITGGATSITSNNLTANRALISNGSGKVAVSAVSSTELGYLDGVTSAIQTQLDGKATSGHTHKYAGSTSSGGSATSAEKVNRSLTIKLNDGTTEGTDMFTFDGSTYESVNINPSNIGAATSNHHHDERYCLNTRVDSLVESVSNISVNKANKEHEHSASEITSGTLSSDRLPTVPITKGGTGATTAAAALTNLGLTATAAELNKLDGVTATTAELNYVDGVTSNIQTQLNAKQATITGGATTIASSDLTANRALVSNGSGKVAVSDVTSTELGYLDGVKSNVQAQIDSKSDSGHTHIYYGECSTAADTAAKTVTVPDFKLETGAMVIVKFTNANSIASPTLNVSGTGAKPMYRYGTTAMSTGTTTTGWRAGAVQQFIYDGTGWVRDFWENTTYSNVSLGQGYTTCTTAAATTAKTASLSSYSLATGGIVSVKFSYDVPAGATLNINSKGAKAIYHRGAAITAGVIKAGDTATFIYSSRYHLISIDKDFYSKTEVDAKEFVTSDALAAYEFITVDDIDTICGSTIVAASEVTF